MMRCENCGVLLEGAELLECCPECGADLYPEEEL